jgi:hypothetical protein
MTLLSILGKSTGGNEQGFSVSERDSDGQASANKGFSF